MSDLGALSFAETNVKVDRIFSNYMDYAATSSLDNMKNYMKKRLTDIKSYNAPNYKNILEFYNNIGYWGKIDPDANVYELIENRAKALKEHYSDLIWLYGRLSDYRSRNTLFGIMDNWLTFSMTSLSKIIDKTFCHYFDLDIIKCDSNEVFVDIGAYFGDTVIDFWHSYNNYKKIYCYEIVTSVFLQLKQTLGDYPNIVFCQKGAGEKNDIMYVTDNEPHISMHKLSNLGTTAVPVVAIDEDITEPVTFIKMDIEGGEQKAILGCRKHIQATHPKLAISVYHNNEDIWKCARIIDEIDPGYKFYLRYAGGNYYPSEYVLLCV